MKYLILAAALAWPVSAQVFKCEENGVVTYSQTPCADDAEIVEVKHSNQPDVTSSVDIEQLCLDFLKLTNNWKDPSSLRVESSFKSWETDKSGARHVLNMRINAKNSYGAYAGAKSHRCFLNHNGDGLSKIQYFIF